MRTNTQSKENSKMAKIYIVKGLEVGGEASDDVTIGWTKSKEKAKQAVEKLQKQNEAELKRWNECACTCEVGCMSWDKADTPEALEKLAKIKAMSKCPYAAQARIAEIFYGPENTNSGWFEIVCGHPNLRCDQPYKYTYVIEELDPIEMEGMTDEDKI